MPLHWAACASHLEIVRLLVEIGASKDQATQRGGYTPLHFAAFCSCLDVVSLLVEVGANRYQPLTHTGKNMDKQ